MAISIAAATAEMPGPSDLERQKEAQLDMSVRFIAPTDYYESFFNSDLAEPTLDINTASSSITDFSSPIGALLNSQDQ